MPGIAATGVPRPSVSVTAIMWISVAGVCAVSTGTVLVAVRLITAVAVIVAAMIIMPTAMSLAAVAGLTVSAVTMFCFLLAEFYSRSGFRACSSGTQHQC